MELIEWLCIWLLICAIGVGVMAVRNAIRLKRDEGKTP